VNALHKPIPDAPDNVPQYKKVEKNLSTVRG